MTNPATRLAERLSRRPGMERWIGPDDDVVVLQAAALAALAWPGRGLWRLPVPVMLLAGAATVAGGAIGIAAVAPHDGRLTPRVEPPAELDLIQHGPYALSRNPIYAGLLLATAGWALLRRRPEPAVAWVALFAILHAKARREERRLHSRFGADYERYRATTPRFLGRGRLTG